MTGELATTKQNEWNKLCYSGRNHEAYALEGLQLYKKEISILFGHLRDYYPKAKTEMRYPADNRNL